MWEGHICGHGRGSICNFSKNYGGMCIASNILDSKTKYDESMILVIHVL